MRPWLFLFAVALGGCYSPNYPLGEYACTTTADCPPNQLCVGGLCGGTAPADLASQPADLAPPCATTLSGIGAGDFSIAFSISTRSTVVSAILHQRWTCDTERDFWDIQLRPDGTLNLQVNQGGGPYTSLGTTVPLNDGHRHQVLLRRSGGSLFTEADGVFSGSTSAPQHLGDLAPVTGTDPCAALRPALDGTLSAVCLMRGTK